MVCSGPLDCPLLLLLGEGSRRGLNHTMPAYLSAPLAQIGLLSLHHPGRLQKWDKAKVAHIPEVWQLLFALVSVCVHLQGHTWENVMITKEECDRSLFNTFILLIITGSPVAKLPVILMLPVFSAIRIK